MSFPRFEINKIENPKDLEKSIGIKISEYYTDSKNGWNLAYVDSDSDLTDLTPNFELISQIVPTLLIVTSLDSKNEYDFFV